MPELPEVERVRLTLLPLLAGRRIEKVRVAETRLRAPVDARALRRAAAGKHILGLRRRAKYLLVDLEGEKILLMHLGMTGRFRIVRAGSRDQVHDHVALALDDGNEVRYNDARRFGLVQVLARGEEAIHPRLRDLGPEPLGAGFGPATLATSARARRRPIKTLLTDATVVAGIGNIYACEVLHAAGIHPGRTASSLSPRRRERLVASIRSLLQEAIAFGGTTLRDFVDAGGEAGQYGEKLRVYGRESEPCETCGRRVRRIVQAGRSTFYCPGCQH
jgi:formamidopyrimidine-DNA glycosylase